MAEALAIVGLVSSIVQFVDFSTKVVHRLNEFSSSLGEVPRTFRHIKTELPLIIDSLRRAKAQAESKELDKATVEALVPVIEACHGDVVSLSDILDEAVPSSGASSWERRKKAILSLGKDKKVVEITESLGNYVRILTLHQTIEGSRAEVQVAKPRFFTLIHSDKNPNFVGREDIFQLINENFEVGEGSQPKAALCGLGGIGKSQIALEFCFRKREQCSIFWVNAGTVARFEESYKRIAAECGLLSHGSAQVDAIQLVQSWLESQYDGPWLMVIDNVDDSKVFFDEQTHNGKTPQQCIPRSSNGALLYTTRNRDVAVDLALPAEPIIVPTLNRAESRQLLSGRLKAKYTQEQASDLLKELEYIPLAITQAAAFMTKRKCSIPQYLDLYRKSDSNRTRFLSYEFSDHGRQLNSMESVAKTWTISFELIKKENPRAADLLSLMSFLDRQAIPLELLHDEAEDSFDFDDAVAILRAFSFIELNDAENSFDMHRLVQLATRWWLIKEQKGEEEKWALEALRLLASRFPALETNTQKSYSNRCSSLLPHAELTLQYNFKITQEEIEILRATLLLHTSEYSRWRGSYQEAQARAEKSYEIRTKHLGKKHPETLRSLGRLFFILLYVKEYNLEMGWQLLESRQEVLGKEHPETIDCLTDIARLFAETGDLEEAEKMFRNALEISERIQGPDEWCRIYCFGGLGTTLDKLGRFEEAEENHCESTRLSEKFYGLDHPETLISYHNLALNLFYQKKLDESIKMYMFVLDMEESALGLDHPDTVIMMSNLLNITDEGDYISGLRQRVLKCNAFIAKRKVPAYKEVLDLLGI